MRRTHLLYASDYPHWDFDLPSTIFDLPFVSEHGKHNILGGTAARLFKLPPRNGQAARKPGEVRRPRRLVLLHRDLSLTISKALRRKAGVFYFIMD